MMSGFRKAKPQQAAIKMSMYGPPGSGKTFTALLFAEYLAKATGKRVAFVDTERGTDFYAQPVPQREPHPEAFDFDAIYTRSLTEVLREVKALNRNEYGVVVVDSVSHLWDAAINSYSGGKTRAGTIPMWAWSKIKAPYKELMKVLIDGPFHVFILGRESNAFEEDETTGEAKAAGKKMRAEGETAYEPHVCLHMVPERDKKSGSQRIACVAEKDRSGILSGKRILWPTAEAVIAPILGILSGEQAPTPSEDEAIIKDSEALKDAERSRAVRSAKMCREFKARMDLAATMDDLIAIGKELTPAVKKDMLSDDVASLKDSFFDREAQLKGLVVSSHTTNGNEQ